MPLKTVLHTASGDELTEGAEAQDPDAFLWLGGWTENRNLPRPVRN